MLLMVETREPQVKAGASLLATIVFAGTFAKQVEESFNELAHLHKNVALWLWLLFLLALAIIAFTSFIRTLRGASRLLKSSELELANVGVCNVIDRIEKANELCEACREFSQVELRGESGVGKTTLIKASMPGMREIGLTPLYVDLRHVGIGPDLARVVSKALWQNLSPEEKGASDLDRDAISVSLPDSLMKCREKFGKDFVIILDHFSDYQTVFDFDAVLGAEEESSGKTLWAQLLHLRSQEKITLVVAQRSGRNLPSRFRSANRAVILVPPIDFKKVIEFLQDLADPKRDKAVIDRPGRGWEGLTERLADDLKQDNRILPSKLKLALRGLTRLKFLTVFEYRASGGLPGLISLAIRDLVSALCSTTSFKEESIMRLLARLAAESEGLSEQQIVDLFGGEISSADLSTLLGELEAVHLIRRRDDSTSLNTWWRLDDPDLTPAIELAESGYDRIGLVVHLAHEKYRAAGHNPIRRYFGLLSPFSYIEARLKWRTIKSSGKEMESFVRRSSVRLIPYVAPIWAIAFLAMAQKGWGVPGGSWIRDYMYCHRISLVSPTPDAEEIRQKLAGQSREVLTSMVSDGRFRNGWFQPKPPEIQVDGKDGAPSKEPWIQAQSGSAASLAGQYLPDTAVKAAKEKGDGSARPTSDLSAMASARGKNAIENLFSDGPATGDVPASPLEGWPPYPGHAHKTIEPILWALSGVANQKTSEGTLNTTQVPHLVSMAKMMRAYAAPGPGGRLFWNIVPFQDLSEPHSIFSTAQALLSLLDVRNSGLPWPRLDLGGKEMDLDTLIRQTAAALISAFKSEGGESGWSALTGKKVPKVMTDPKRPPMREALAIRDGLTAQVYVALLRYRDSTGDRLPKQILQAIPLFVSKFESHVPPGQRESEWDKDDLSDIGFTNHTGGRTTKDRSTLFRIMFAWYPWALELTWTYARDQRAENYPNPHEGAMALRTLNHLVLGLGESEKSYLLRRETFTFEQAEYLYTVCRMMRGHWEI